MFMSLSQIRESLKHLEKLHPFYMTTFLVCKKSNLPVGSMTEFPISSAEKEFLDNYFNPVKQSDFYYRVWRIGSTSQRWVNKKKYASSTAQSTRTRGDLSKAFLHESDTPLWGWQHKYVDVLEANLTKYKRGKLPAFHLAVWLYRDKNWPDEATPEEIVHFFYGDFHISSREKEHLFVNAIPSNTTNQAIFEDECVTWGTLQEITELPPDLKPEGGILSSLKFRGVGPAKQLEIEFSDRLNIITGDNGLGKSFILEAAWWALSGTWVEHQLYPRDDAVKEEPSIVFHISGSSAKPERISARYHWLKQRWSCGKGCQTVPGLLIYARVDGTFAVWDPARSAIDNEANAPKHLFFSRDDVWNGKSEKVGGRTRYLCNGLINDWINWQNNPETSPFDTLTKVLAGLSPPDLSHGDLGILKPGKPTRIPGESRPIPTIEHPYGEIPLVYASASVQRIVALAYFLVWSWEEHKAQSELIRERPQSQMGILVDELEAHLHPQWQRRILPALLDVADDLEKSLSIQFLITTHSPLVLASIEPRFGASDKIFHLDLTKLTKKDEMRGTVIINSPEFVRYGSADSWLMSEIFEMRQPRSIQAETAIKDATELQQRDNITQEEVEEISNRLVEYLPAHDKFWPRWTFFAKNHGVVL
jgi:hypothetical protein